MAGKYGELSPNYAPDVITYTGMIGKIAKQVIEVEGVKSLFDVFQKDDIEYGKDLEIALYEMATGEAYNRKASPTERADDPKAHVLLFKELIERTYGVTVDENQIRLSANNATVAERNAEIIIDTLYQGAQTEKNANVMNLFTGAITGTAGEGFGGEAAVIGYEDNGANAFPVTDEATARAYVLAVRTVAKNIRNGSTSVNLGELKVRAKRVIMVVPSTTVDKVDVLLRMNVYNDEYSRFAVDEVVEYDPKEYPEAKGATWICDERFIQLRKQREYYGEQPIARSANVDAYLNTSYMYAACPLFDCVVIRESVE